MTSAKYCADEPKTKDVTQVAFKVTDAPECGANADQALAIDLQTNQAQPDPAPPTPTTPPAHNASQDYAVRRAQHTRDRLIHAATICINAIIIGALLVVIKTQPELIYYMGCRSFILENWLLLTCVLLGAMGAVLAFLGLVRLMRSHSLSLSSAAIFSSALNIMVLPLVSVFILMPAIMHLFPDQTMSRDQKIRIAYALTVATRETQALHQLLDAIAAKANAPANALEMSRSLYANYLLMATADRANDLDSFKHYLERTSDILARTGDLPPLQVASENQRATFDKAHISQSLLEHISQMHSPNRQLIVNKIYLANPINAPEQAVSPSEDVGK